MANAILAKLIVMAVKLKVLKDSIYFLISKIITKLINVTHNINVLILVTNSTFEIKIINY